MDDDPTLRSHYSYSTTVSSMKRRMDEGINGGPQKLSVEAVRATAKRRTAFAMQVLAASKATLEATDAMLAATDAIKASRIGSSARQYGHASIPEACEVSEDSETEKTASSHGVLTSSTNQKEQPNDISKVEDGEKENDQGPSDSSSAADSSSEMEEPSTSSQVESTEAERSSHATDTVEFLLKGSQSRDSLADLPISASLLSGSFAQKVPIPQYIISGQDSALALTPVPNNQTGGTPQVSEKVDSKMPAKQPVENESDDASSASSSSISEGSSSSSSSGSGSSSEEGSATENEPSNHTQSSDARAEKYVKDLLGGLQGSQQPKPNSSNIVPLKPAADSSKETTTAAIPALKPIPVPVAAVPVSIFHPSINDIHCASLSDAVSDAPSDTTGKSGSSNIENDDYVKELLSELQETKEISVHARSLSATRAPESMLSSLAATAKMSDDEEEEESDSTGDDFGSSEEECSDDMFSRGVNEEDDDYVDELLKELDATKPSSLIPEQDLHTTPFAQHSRNKPPTDTISTDSSVSDEDISDIEGSSSSDYNSSDGSPDSGREDADEDDETTDEDISEEDSDCESGEEGNAFTSSDEGTSDDDEETYVDDLLNELQAPRKAQPKPVVHPKLTGSASSAPPPPPPDMPLPVSALGGLPGMGGALAMSAIPGLGGMSGLGGGGEGLNLDTIRAELEKVGRAVMTQKSGVKFVERAQILASINQLSSHVPNCVLEFLGKEVKAGLERKRQSKEKPAEEQRKTKKGQKKMLDVVSTDDGMSAVSEMSSIDISEKEEDHNGKFLIDTTEVDLDGDSECSDGSRQSKTPPPLALMRRKSIDGVHRIFEKAKTDGSVANLSEDIKIDKIFNSSNEYGLTLSKATSHSGSVASSNGSIGSRKLKRKSTSRGANVEGKLPSFSKFECALLFIDISGFTKLSTLLDPETLSKVINSYFQMIVSKVYEFNGDIQKFAGDAIFAEWRCDGRHSMDFCVAAATACASQLVDECSDFPVMAGGAISKTGEPISSLNIHCALGAGQMVGIHVGDHTRRREYLFLGEPIEQLTWGADLAKNGEFVVSPEAFRSLSLAGVLDFRIRPSEHEPAIIAKRGVTMFKSEKLNDYKVSRAEYAMSRGVTGHVEGLEVEDLKTYQKLMALYVHPVVAAIHLHQKIKMKTKSSAQERHREEAELRRVYIMFIHPLIEISEENGYAVDMLNEIMNLTSTQLERYCGHLRQMIVDDKGLVLIGTFGLRGSTFPNMVAERALPATIALHNALQSQLGVDNRIGATFGEVYCGAVGGVKRHEYAVLGPSANLAARLMGNKDNPGILVECNIRRMASRKYAFNALPPVKAKGYAENVPIFEPLCPLERSWGRIQPNFVGRETEIKAMMSMARDIVSSQKPHSRLVFVASQSGMGKSTMVAHAIEHIRNMIGNDARRLVITKHVGKESSSLLPFGVFRSILLEVLANFAASSDDKSLASGASGFTSSQSLSLASLSAKSQGSSIALSLARSEELLKVLCRELNTPSSVVDHVLHSLSGESTAKNAFHGKAPSMKSMVSFMSRAFKRCTEETKLVVVALDDVQYIDEMTWKVLRQVFEGCNNVLIVCAFDLSRSRDLKVEADFWSVLNSKYRPAGYFVPMELAGLGKEEITIMTMKTLGLQRGEISPDLLNEVHIQSGGMPHFANEFLELVKRRKLTQMMDERMEGRTSGSGAQTLGTNNLGSVPEIILHRIDSFDVNVRNILNIAAVLGKSFQLKEVIAVMKESLDMQEAAIYKEGVAALNTAVIEGILREEDDESSITGRGGEEEAVKKSQLGNAKAVDDEKDSEKRDDEDEPKEKSDQTIYTFYHSIWQTTILSLMLDARRKDVHKKIALSMEKEMNKDGSNFEFQMKLLGHWKASGNTNKATKVALDVGKHFEKNLSLPTQSIRIYEEALDVWRDDKPSDFVGGLSPAVLDAVEPSELADVCSLHVALGRAFNGAGRNAESALSFYDALRILRVPKNANKVEDRSMGYPAYVGLYECLKANYIVQEENKRYEQVLVKRFLEDTKHHKNKYHHVQAITCQMDLFRRYGDIQKAVAVQSLLYEIYDHEVHTNKLQEIYGSDDAAVSFSYAAMWNWELGNKDAALDACRFVIGKLMPKMDRSNVHQSFMVMYPVVLVMKSYDVAVQARKHFDRLVVKPFGTFFGEGKSSFFLPVYEPIMMLLHLASFSDMDEDTLEEYTEWALDRDRLCFGTLANRRLGALGRCADSLSAEICFLLADRIQDEETRHILIEHGKEIGQDALIFNKEQNLKTAEQQVQLLLENSAELIAELDGAPRAPRLQTLKLGTASAPALPPPPAPVAAPATVSQADESSSEEGSDSSSEKDSDDNSNLDDDSDHSESEDQGEKENGAANPSKRAVVPASMAPAANMPSAAGAGAPTPQATPVSTTLQATPALDLAAVPANPPSFSALPPVQPATLPARHAPSDHAPPVIQPHKSPVPIAPEALMQALQEVGSSDDDVSDSGEDCSDEDSSDYDSDEESDEESSDEE